MIFAYLEGWIGWHFVFESIFILAIIAEEHVFVHIQHAVFNIFLAEGHKQLAIEVISDSATIEHLADHVLQHGGVDLLHNVLLRRNGC